MSAAFLGICGSAFALLSDTNRLLALDSLPRLHSGQVVCGPSFRELLRPSLTSIASAAIERQTRSNDAACEAFASGCLFGSTLAALSWLSIEANVVTPLRWRAALGLDANDLGAVNEAGKRFGSHRFFVNKPTPAVAALLAVYARQEALRRTSVAAAVKYPTKLKIVQEAVL